MHGLLELAMFTAEVVLPDLLALLLLELSCRRMRRRAAR